MQGFIRIDQSASANFVVSQRVKFASFGDGTSNQLEARRSFENACGCAVGSLGDLVQAWTLIVG